MKVNKTICLEQELVEKLKQENASALINMLLFKHFNENNNSDEAKETKKNIDTEIQNLEKQSDDLQIGIEKKEKEESKIQDSGLSEQEIKFFDAFGTLNINDMVKGYHQNIDAGIPSLEVMKKLDKFKLL